VGGSRNDDTEREGREWNRKGGGEGEGVKRGRGRGKEKKGKEGKGEEGWFDPPLSNTFRGP